MKIEDILTEEQQKDLERVRRCNEVGLCIGCNINDNHLCGFDYVESAYSIINTLITALDSVPTTTPEKRADFVYVCSPFSSDPMKNVELARKYCAEIWREGKIPIATHLYFPQFVNELESSERLRAIGYGEKAVGICSEIRVFGNYISDGMKREITAAVKAGVPIRWCEA